ncbi:hypothetical protein FRC11_006158, partial [Ceratobasidium sp. 423]
MQALRTARKALESALDSYAGACVALADCSGSGFTLNADRNIPEFVNAEMELYTTFEEKAARVKRLLGKARNSLTSIVPITSLPDEVLLRVFRLVMHEELLDFEYKLDRATPDIRTLTISQVCTRWRQIALSSRSLWSKIELSIRREIFPLGDIFADRSGGLPLNVRVIESYTGWGGWGFHLRPSISRFFSRIGPRVASFEFAMLPPLNAQLPWPVIHLYTLASSFKHWKPGQLTRLALSDRSISSDRKLGDEYFESSAHWFLFPRTKTEQAINSQGSAIWLDVSPQHFEDVLAPVKVLELDLIYPFWASKAYHGLVELRLTGPRQLTAVITTQQLANILESSPELRVLHFGLEVSLTEASPQPVHLRGLEVFILHSLHYDTQQAVLKLIAPGQKPLQMSTMYNGSQPQCLPARFHDEFYQFFSRSNTSHLELYGIGFPVRLPNLLALLPNLQTLVLRQVTLEKIEPSDRDNEIVPLCSQLHSLHLRYCRFALETLRWVVSTHNPQEITLYSGEVGPCFNKTHPGDMESMTVLLNISPFIKVLDYDSAVGMGDRVLALSDIYARNTRQVVVDEAKSCLVEAGESIDSTIPEEELIKTWTLARAGVSQAIERIKQAGNVTAFKSVSVSAQDVVGDRVGGEGWEGQYREQAIKMQALRTARQALESALDNYAEVCVALADCSGSGFTLNNDRNLPESMNTEMELYTDFEEKAARVKRLLGKARNSLTSIVPINSLPNEVLLRVFRLAMHNESISFEGELDGTLLQIHILAASQACTRWRQVALSSRSLWSKIKLSVLREILPLGKIFADRSGDLPLDICVIEPYKKWGEWDPDSHDSVTRFFSSVGPRVASFEFAMFPPLNSPRRWSLMYIHVLRSGFKHWQPGQLTRFALSDRNTHSVCKLGDECFKSSAHWFLFPRTTTGQAINSHGNTICLDVDLQHFEDLLVPVKVLELDFIYPFWASKAYHGLVELRLTGPRQLTTIITTQQLADILESSPELRVLHFGLEVSLTEASPQPVHLRDLEALILHSHHYDTQQAVLKLIAPGQKPLQMSTMYNGPQLQCIPTQFHDEFCQFFRRSSISQLEVYAIELPVRLPNLLALLPNLQTLIFRRVTLEEIEPSDRD